MFFSYLERLNLADKDILKRVDSLALTGNLVSNGVVNQLGNNILQIGGRNLTLHDLEHLAANALDLNEEKKNNNKI